MEPSLLERCRRDRRQLLSFILSSGLITEVRTPSGSATTSSISGHDLDILSAEYVLECIQSGGVLDISKATKRYYEEFSYPAMIRSQSGNSYFFLSDPESAGSPPQRAPPPVKGDQTISHVSNSSNLLDPLVHQNVAVSGVKYDATRMSHSKPVKIITVPPLGLPPLNTGISDDDLRESAFEILLASMIFSGIEIPAVEVKKKDKSSNLLSGLKSKRDRKYARSQLPGGHSDLLNTIRMQMQEADEVMKLMKLSWSTLGINEKIHNALFGWVLFQQFVRTDEAVLLDYAILQVQKVLSADGNNEEEEQYMSSLTCLTEYDSKGTKLNLVQALFFSMSVWCDSKLQDYHLHFCQKPCFFRRVLTLALAVGDCSFNECHEIKFKKSDASDEIVSRKLRTYVETSIKAASYRVTQTIDLESKIEKTHPLALLANELRLIAEKELNLFFPLLRQWYSEAGKVSAILLHQFYGERLKPFLKGVSCLSEDVRSVLPAADKLQHDLTWLYTSAHEDNASHSPCNLQFDPYQIGEVSKPIILDWIVAQHDLILEWTGRVFDLEEWEPLSHQQKHAASAVELFRIIEETVDQLFGLSLSLDIAHLRALLSIIFHTLDTYLLRMANQIVERHHLYPSVPSLTRYEETVFPVTKKKLYGSVLLEEEVNDKLNALTISTLCIRLNTLQYIQKQVNTLEDGIRKSWALVGQYENQTQSKEKSLEPSESPDRRSIELVDELFIANFDSIKDTAADTIREICDFTGAKVVFWDLRDSFLFHLYRGSVEGARLDNILPYFDTVLNHICGSIDDNLRDFVVSSICRASMEGYVWVLLDGGPSCAFSVSDISMMEDDLNILKDLLVADGEGLPRSLVEKEASFAHQVLNLFSLQTESVIQMLMSSSEHIAAGWDSRNDRCRYLGDAHTLIRILCHKKDKEASKFLKRHYQLPASSEYDDTPAESNSKSPLGADLTMRSRSFHWSEKGSTSFRSIKKKLKEATSDVRHAAW